MIKKLYAINYVVLRAFFVIGALALFLGVLPANPETGRRAVHCAIGGVSIALGVGLAFAGRAVKRKGLEDGLAPDVFTPRGSRAIMSYFWLIVMTIIIVLPFYVIVVTSIKTEYESASLGFSWWPKLGVTGSAYKYVTTSEILGITIIGAFLNTLRASVLPTVVTVFVSALSAYSFSKLEFRGKKPLFGILLLTMMVPGCITLISSYLLFDLIHWTNSFKPLVVPMLFGSAGVVFFLREYFAGIPDDLLGSARIDGLGDMGIFFHIIMPLSVPAVVAQLVLTFCGRYNDFMGPLVYLTGNEMYTLTIYMRATTSGTIYNNRSAAACVVAIAPLLIIYFFLQKVILSGIAMSSGLKA